MTQEILVKLNVKEEESYRNRKLGFKKITALERGIGIDARIRVLWMRRASISGFEVLNMQQFLVITSLCDSQYSECICKLSG